MYNEVQVIEAMAVRLGGKAGCGRLASERENVEISTRPCRMLLGTRFIGADLWLGHGLPLLQIGGSQ
jgi:hypothetical protein